MRALLAALLALGPLAFTGAAFVLHPRQTARTTLGELRFKEVIGEEVRVGEDLGVYRIAPLRTCCWRLCCPVSSEGAEP